MTADREALREAVLHDLLLVHANGDIAIRLKSGVYRILLRSNTRLQDELADAILAAVKAVECWRKAHPGETPGQLNPEDEPPQPVELCECDELRDQRDRVLALCDAAGGVLGRQMIRIAELRDIVRPATSSVGGKSGRTGDVH